MRDVPRVSVLRTFVCRVRATNSRRTGDVCRPVRQIPSHLPVRVSLVTPTVRRAPDRRFRNALAVQQKGLYYRMVDA